jgi:hypothetical protein
MCLPRETAAFVRFVRNLVVLNTEDDARGEIEALKARDAVISIPRTVLARNEEEGIDGEVDIHIWSHGRWACYSSLLEAQLKELSRF